MFTDCYGTQLRRSARALTRLYDEALKADGILLTQFSLLRALDRLGSATFHELAEEVALDKTTISRNVKVLDAAGWVEFEPTEDLREKRILLSAAGSEKLKAATANWRVAQTRIRESAREMFAKQGGDPLIEALEKFQMLTLSDTQVDTNMSGRKRKS